MCEQRASDLMNTRVTVAAVLSEACAQLGAVLVLEKSLARLEARVLAAHAWGVSPSWLIAHDTDRLTQQQSAHFMALLARRLRGEPIAYITGEREFYGRSFRVTPDVLIPRPETELLVEQVLAQMPLHESIHILELGTGSGCIAISLALERPDARITATDKSDAVLAVAQSNAHRLGAEIEWVKSDWFSTLEHRKFDFIVSNPPYVACHDTHLGQGDVRYEPQSALASGLRGLDDLIQIISQAPAFLQPPARIVVEHGYDQAGAVAQLLVHTGFGHINTVRDLAGQERVSTGVLSV